MSQTFYTPPLTLTRIGCVAGIFSSITFLLYRVYQFFHPKYPPATQPAYSSQDFLVLIAAILFLLLLAASVWLLRFRFLQHALAALSAICFCVMFFLQTFNTSLNFLVLPISLWFLMYVHWIFDRHDKKKNADLKAETDLPSAIVPTDKKCVFCGYNIRGLPVVGRCPECGHPIRFSLASAPIARYYPRWFMFVSLGLLIFAIGYPIWDLVSFMMFSGITRFEWARPLKWLRIFEWYPDYALHLFFLSVMMGCIGVWLATIRDKTQHVVRGQRCRWIPRVFIILVVVYFLWETYINFVVTHMQTDRILRPNFDVPLPQLSELFAPLNPLLDLLGNWFFLFYLYLLATRIPSRKLQRHGLILMAVMLFMFSLSTLMPILDEQCLYPLESRLSKYGPQFGTLCDMTFHHIIPLIPIFWLSLYLIAYIIRLNRLLFRTRVNQ